uniref:hypothetical protein n=1 Tax=Chitinimonas sp. TaxID=1934313 RepID=UPI0035AD8CCE
MSLWRHALLALPLTRWNWWLAAMLTALLAWLLLGLSGIHPLSTALADRIVAANPRPTSSHTARVVFDAGIPLSVSREQALTLDALALERLAALGASHIVLDGQIALRNRRQQRFVSCLPPQNQPIPLCSLLGETPCLSAQGRSRQAPLDLDAAAHSRLVLPEPLSDRTPPPYVWLFGSAGRPRFASPELPVGADGLVRAVLSGPA